MSNAVSKTDLIGLWKRRSIVAQRSHYATAVRLDRRNQVVGLVTVVINVIVSSTLFATLLTALNDDPYIKIVAGIFGLAGAILVGVQTFRRDGEKAERHRVFAAKFSVMQRELELIESKNFSDDDLEMALTAFNQKYSALITEAPVPNERDFQRQFKLHLAASAPVGGVQPKIISAKDSQNA